MSRAGLRRFCQPIGLLYLDSYDYSEKRVDACQRHQLAELGAAIGKLDIQGALVLIDDCDLPNGGKGRLSQAYLEDLGNWEKIHDGYQALWKRR